MERLLEALGLNEYIDVEALKATVQTIEDQLENPDQLIKDYLGFSLQEEIDQQVDLLFADVPDIGNLESVIGEKLDFKIEGYIPILDVTGPYAFFPPHCYPGGVNDEERKDLRDATKYNSPVIAHVKTGASLESDIVDQLRSLFETQQSGPQLIAGLDVLDLLGDDASGMKDQIGRGGLSGLNLNLGNLFQQSF